MRPVELRDITMDDLPLYERTATDPSMMAELGGPLPRAGLAEKLRGIEDDVQAGRVWFFTIIPDREGGTAAGTVCVWDHKWNGEMINEIGWMVVPEFQGRGLASEAVRAVLERARAQGRWDVIHAFPAVTNGPSNAICRKTGFSKIAETDFEYAGRPLRCNIWRIDLRRS
jgi:RimJ/RimL family protein N-acetyltransferase